MLWETGHSIENEQEILHCSYENDNCYQAKTVPVIYDISQNTGYTTGGQNLTIDGYGFDNENIDIKIDGVDCVVQEYSKESITC